MGAQEEIFKAARMECADNRRANHATVSCHMNA